MERKISDRGKGGGQEAGAGRSLYYQIKSAQGGRRNTQRHGRWGWIGACAVQWGGPPFCVCGSGSSVVGKEDREWRTQGYTEKPGSSCKKWKLQRQSDCPFWWGPHATISGALETEKGIAPFCRFSRLLETRAMATASARSGRDGDSQTGSARGRDGYSRYYSSLWKTLPEAVLRLLYAAEDGSVSPSYMASVVIMQGSCFSDAGDGEGDGVSRRTKGINVVMEPRGAVEVDKPWYISHNPRDKKDEAKTMQCHPSCSEAFRRSAGHCRESSGGPVEVWTLCYNDTGLMRVAIQIKISYSQLIAELFW